MFLPNRHRWWFRLAVMMGAVALFLAGYHWGNQVQRARSALPAIGGVLVRPPAAVPRFRLEDPNGRVFDQGSLAEGWTLLAFGDLTGASGQRAVARLIDLYNRVSDQEDLYRGLRLVLVTPDDLGERTGGPAPDFARLSPALWVLGGPAAERERLGAALGAEPGAPVGARPGLGSDLDTLYVFAPGGALIAAFTGETEPARTAADLTALHDHLDLLLPEGQ